MVENAQIVQWIITALIGLVTFLLGYMVNSVKDEQKELHIRISHEQGRINQHAERLSSLESYQKITGQQLTRLETKLDSISEKLDGWTCPYQG